MPDARVSCVGNVSLGAAALLLLALMCPMMPSLLPTPSAMTASFLVAAMVRRLPAILNLLFLQDNDRTAVLGGGHCTGPW